MEVNEDGSDPKAALLGSEPPTVTDVVKSIGAGPAQLRMLAFCCGGIMLCDGAELILGNVLVQSLASEFELNRNERALFATLTLTGLMFGILTSGYFGDTYGRLRPTLWSFFFTAVMGFLCSCMPSYGSLLVSRTILGFSMGFGMPPSSAMLSENTPEAWRIPLRIFTIATFNVGGMFAVLLAAADDTHYQHLRWRRLMAIMAVPPVVFGLLSACFLHESPVFLASVGQRSKAQEAFAAMARLNGAEGVDVAYAELPAVGSSGRRPSLWQQVCTVFSPRLRYTSVAMLFTALCINMLVYGDGYAAPIVLAKTSALAPAWQICIKTSIAMTWTVLGGMLAQVISRKFMMILGAALSSAVCFAFAIAGAHAPPRPWFLAVLFQYGVNGLSAGPSIAFVVLWQISAEIYPTTVASTGGAIIMGGARLAALSGPLVFENIWKLTGQWEAFYYLMGGLLALAVLILAFMRATKAHRPGEGEKGELDDVLETKVPLSSKNPKCYGSVAGAGGK
mmetsp:Transcript_8246/g.25662  ORF Transcript_8246/g.25662 Transcript_8246/m.25662 type:complete len:507 (+) Transcript_8246:153-1673(+)